MVMKPDHFSLQKYHFFIEKAKRATFNEAQFVSIALVTYSQVTLQTHVYSLQLLN